MEQTFGEKESPLCAGGEIRAGLGRMGRMEQLGETPGVQQGSEHGQRKVRERKMPESMASIHETMEDKHVSL